MVTRHSGERSASRSSAKYLKRLDFEAPNGDAQACLDLGGLYERGVILGGIQKDKGEARYWYMRAADIGEIETRFTAGMSLIRLLDDRTIRVGFLADPIYEQAFELILGAAEQGYVAAQNYLFEIHNDLESQHYDPTTAAKWCCEAGNRGDIDAQRNLAHIYRIGDGVPQNYVLSHFWLNVAASQAKTTEDQQWAAEQRDRLAENMTAEQIADAQKRAVGWKPLRGAYQIDRAKRLKKDSRWTHLRNRLW